MYSGDEIYGDDLTSGPQPDEQPDDLDEGEDAEPDPDEDEDEDEDEG